MTITVIQGHLLQFVYLAGLSILATGYGLYCLHNASLSFVNRTEKLVFSVAIGFGALGYTVFFLAATQMLHPVSLWIIIIVYAVLAGRGWMTLIKANTPWSSSYSENRFKASVLDHWAGLILLSAVIVGTIFVFTPSSSNDALSYHLTVPREYLSHHGFFYIPGNLFSNYPLLGEMVYLLSLFLSGDVTAKGIHFLMTLLVLVSMNQFSRTYFSDESPRYIPALIFFTLPSVFIIAHSAYTDLFLTFYMFIAVWAYANWYRRSETGWLILCGLLTGLAAGTKYAGLYLPFLGGFGICLAARLRRSSAQNASRNLLYYTVAFLVAGSPFYIKNAILTGNPIYPFFYSIFGGKGWDATLGRYYDLFLNSLGMGRSLIDYLLLPWNLSFQAKLNSPQFDGIIGPIFIFTLPFVLGIRKIPQGFKIGLMFSGLMFLFWASSAQQIRYLIPIFPFLSLITGYVLYHYQRKKIVYAILVGMVGICIGINGFHITKHYLKIRPERYVFGYEDKHVFLSRMIPSYDIIRFINARLSPDTKIFLIYMKNLGFLYERPYYSDSMFESYTIQKYLSRSTSPEAVYMKLKNDGFTHLLYDIQYVLGNFSPFTQQEKDLFASFQDQFLKLITSSKNRYFLYGLKI